MQDTVVGDNAEMSYVITDKNVAVGTGKLLTSSSEYPMYVGKGASL